MSFLANLERGELWRYGSNGVGGGISRGEGRGGGAGGTRERLWDMQGTRIQVNLIAIWGDDVVDNGPVPADDEHFLTVELVGRLGRREFFPVSLWRCWDEVVGRRALDCGWEVG